MLSKFFCQVHNHVDLASTFNQYPTQAYQSQIPVLAPMVTAFNAIAASNRDLENQQAIQSLFKSIVVMKLNSFQANDPGKYNELLRKHQDPKYPISSEAQAAFQRANLMEKGSIPEDISTIIRSRMALTNTR